MLCFVEGLRRSATEVLRVVCGTFRFGGDVLNVV